MIPQFSPADRFREIEKEAFPIPESFKSHAFMSSDLYNQAIVQVGQYWRSLFHEDQGPLPRRHMVLKIASLHGLEI